MILIRHSKRQLIVHNFKIVKCKYILLSDECDLMTKIKFLVFWSHVVVHLTNMCSIFTLLWTLAILKLLTLLLGAGQVVYSGFIRAPQ